MSAPIIFSTGVSGYIGGQVAKAINQNYPNWHQVVLVRSEAQASIIKATWPDVETVIGDLDSHEILVEQGKRADVVLQLASADHIGAGNSIIEGMGRGKKGHYIHTSGTGILHDVSNGYGNSSPKIYSDVADIQEILSFDLSHVHRDVDAAVIAAGLKYGVPTAIVTPDTIHGIGEGPIKKRSIQIPFLTEAILKRQKAFIVGAGNNYWDNVHVKDLADAYLILVNEALKPNGGAAAWGPTGYYFTAVHEHRWGDITKSIAKISAAKGAIPTDEVEVLTPEEATKVHPWATVLWGGNCRSRSDGLKALGWKPVGPLIEASLDSMIQFEIDTLGSHQPSDALMYQS